MFIQSIHPTWGLKASPLHLWRGVVLIGSATVAPPCDPARFCACSLVRVSATLPSAFSRCKRHLHSITSVKPGIMTAWKRERRRLCNISSALPDLVKGQGTERFVLGLARSL